MGCLWSSIFLIQMYSAWPTATSQRMLANVHFRYYYISIPNAVTFTRLLNPTPQYVKSEFEPALSTTPGRGDAQLPQQSATQRLKHMVRSVLTIAPNRRYIYRLWQEDLVRTGSGRGLGLGSGLGMGLGLDVGLKPGTEAIPDVGVCCRAESN
jgi:hypothetical protein